MRTMILVQPELTRVANELILATQDFLAVSFIGGDRISCCDEGVVAKRWGRVIGLATIAPHGEVGSGEPTIVGVYVLPTYRRRGIGRAVFEAAVQRCVERGFEKIRVDALTRGGLQLTQVLPAELAERLDVRDFSYLTPF